MTPSMRTVFETLQLERVYIVHAADASFPMGESIHALGLARVQSEIEPLR